MKDRLCGFLNPAQQRMPPMKLAITFATFILSPTSMFSVIKSWQACKTEPILNSLRLSCPWYSLPGAGLQFWCGQGGCPYPPHPALNIFQYTKKGGAVVNSPQTRPLYFLPDFHPISPSRARVIVSISAALAPSSFIFLTTAATREYFPGRRAAATISLSTTLPARSG